VTAASDLADRLPPWLPHQRWYAGKGRDITGVEVVSSTTLRSGDPELRHLVVSVTAADRTVDRYQLLLGLRDELPDRLAHAAIGDVDGRRGYDAVHDHDLTSLLLERVADGTTVDGLRFTPEPGVDLDTSQVSRVSSAEQSNTSLVYGELYILKLFRRLSEGVNPDLEIHRALASVGCRHIAAPLGSISDDNYSYAMLQAYVANAADGWHMATTSVRDLYAEGDLHADEVGGDFAGWGWPPPRSTVTWPTRWAATRPGRRSRGPPLSRCVTGWRWR
jgi:maltokinase